MRYGTAGKFWGCFGTVVRKSAFTFENEIMDVESMKEQARCSGEER